MRKQILVASLTFTLLAILQPLSNFLLLPIYTNNFTIQEYATFSILNNLSAFFIIFSGLGIVNAVTAFYPVFKNDQQTLNEYFSNIMLFIFYSSAILFLFLVIFGEAIFKMIFKTDIQFYPLGILCTFYSLITNVSTGYLLFLKMEKNTSRYFFIMIVIFFFNTFLQYYFIVFLHTGAKGAWIARCITSIISILLIFIYHFKYIFLKLNYKKFIIPSLKYSIPIIPSAILGWVTSYGDRFLIERFVDLKSLGIYSFLLTISSLTETVYLALGAALQPFIFDFFIEKNANKISSLYSFFIIITICLSAGVTMIGSNLNLIVKNNTYLEAVPYLSIMIVGFCIASLSFMYNLQIIYAQKSKYFLYQSSFILPLNIILNLIMIPIIGIWGAVIATFLTKLTISITSKHYAEKSFHIGTSWRYIIPIIIYTFLSLIGLFLGYMDIVPYNLFSIFQFVTILSLSSIMYYKKIKVLLLDLRQKIKFN